MKKFVAVVLAASMMVLTACGGSSSDSSTSTTAAAAAEADEAGGDTTAAEDPYNGQTWTIKAAVTQADTDVSPEVRWLKDFKAEVEEKTNGAVTVDIYPSGQLGTDTEVVQGLMGNTIELGLTNYTNLNNVYADTMLMSCPGVFASEQEVNDILRGDWGTEFHKKLEDEIGIKVLTVFSNGFRCFTTSNKELTTVDTAKGVTFRTMTNEVSVIMVEAIGANAVPMASSEMYTALENGTVDGQENPVVNILNDKTYEVQKYLVLDKHIASIASICMSAEFFNSLPEDIQDIIVTAANNANANAEQMVEDLNEDGIQQLEDYGMTVYDPTDEERAAWQDAMSGPCMDYIRGQIGDEIVDSLEAEIDAYRGV